MLGARDRTIPMRYVDINGIDIIKSSRFNIYQGLLGSNSFTPDYLTLVGDDGGSVSS